MYLFINKSEIILHILVANLLQFADRTKLFMTYPMCAIISMYIQYHITMSESPNQLFYTTLSNREHKLSYYYL